MATKLGLYNGALREIGDTRLASLTENNVARRTLDDAYDEAVAFCLQNGQWNFAMRAVQMDASNTIDPAFGYSYAFEKQTDWVRTCAVCSDEYFTQPLLRYEDEVQLLYADIDPIFCKYVSDDTDFGMDLSLWPASFTHYVQVYLARRVCVALTNSRSTAEALDKDVNRALSKARSLDAMDEATKFPAPGSWVMSRRGRISYRRPDRV